jgi:WD40 repeat protein
MKKINRLSMEQADVNQHSFKPLTNVASLLLLSLLFVLSGCDTKPTDSQTATGTIPSPSGNVASTPSPIVDEKNANSLPSEPKVEVAELVELGSNQSPKSEDKNLSKPVAAEVKVEPALVVPVAKLTTEQEKLWAWPEYEQVELLKFKEWPMAGLVTSTAQTKDGKFYLLAGNKVSLWSVDGNEPEHVFLDFSRDSQQRFIKSIIVSPDGKYLAAGDSEGTLTLWNLTDRQEIFSKSIDTSDINDIAISPDFQEIATISFGGEISIWSTDKLEPKNKFKVNTNSVSQIEFLKNGSLLVFGEKAMVLRTQDGFVEKELPTGRYHKTIARSDDGKWIVTSSDEQLQLWDENLAMVGNIAGNFASQETLAFEPNGKFLATANGSSIRLWDIENRKLAQVIDTSGSAIVGLQWLKEPAVLVVTTDFGQTRIWATASNASKHGLEPVHKPIALPDPNKRIPPLHSQLTSVIDLRTFPMLPGSKPSVAMASSINYNAPTNVDDSKLFYRYHLGKRGWMEQTDASANPYAITFRKNGSILSASFYDAGGTGTSVSVHHSGTYDLRWTPMLSEPATTVTYQSEGTVHCESKATLLEIETELYRKLAAAGWTGYSRLHASHDEKVDSRSLSFIQNGIELRVSVGKFPSTPTTYTIQYSPFPATESLPIPKDAGFVELEHTIEPRLVATTSMSLSETQVFYDAEMESQGWLPKKSGRSIKDEHAWLSYFQGQKDVVIGLEKMENGRTLIRVGKNLDQSSWQLAKPEAKEDKPNDVPEVGIEAIDFPILKASKKATYDARGKRIEFTAEQTKLADLTEQYIKSMEALGWEADKFGVRSDDYTLLPFKKDKKEISVRSVIRDGNALVSVEGDGLLWNKPLGGENQIISYETWLRDHRYPAGLELLDKYQAEMKALEPKK